MEEKKEYFSLLILLLITAKVIPVIPKMLQALKFAEIMLQFPIAYLTTTNHQRLRRMEFPIQVTTIHLGTISSPGKGSQQRKFLEYTRLFVIMLGQIQSEKSEILS